MNTAMRGQSRNHLTIALAAAAVFALGLGLRQAQPLFISSLNSHTGIGYATISLAFGVAQLMWGVAQPVAGAIADRWGPRWVMIAGAVLLAAANVATPFSGNAMVLTLLIGVAAAAGAGALGPAMLISAANRWIPEAKRSVATGIINAGGSFGQFTIIPLAQLLMGIAGWQPAMVILGVTGLAAIPLVMILHAACVGAIAFRRPQPQARSARRCARRSAIRASSCSMPVSSPADSTSLSSQPIFRAWLRCAQCPPR